VPATAYPYAWGPSDGGARDLVGVRFQIDASGAKASDFLGKPLDVKVDLGAALAPVSASSGRGRLFVARACDADSPLRSAEPWS
jgi:hypothetical protein